MGLERAMQWDQMWVEKKGCVRVVEWEEMLVKWKGEWKGRRWGIGMVAVWG